MYAQAMYILDRVPILPARNPELKSTEPFKTILSGNLAAVARLSTQDLEKLVAATLTGMTVDQFSAEAAGWLARTQDPRWHRPYADLTYLPMMEVMRYSAPERLPDLHRHRGRTGFCARVLRTGLRDSRAGSRHRRRNDLRLR